MKEHHVLVMGISRLLISKEGKVARSEYTYDTNAIKNAGKDYSQWRYEGFSQMEPVPAFIHQKEGLNEHLTDLILLETKETKEKHQFTEDVGSLEKWIESTGEKSSESRTDDEKQKYNSNAVDYFLDRIQKTLHCHMMEPSSDKAVPESYHGKICVWHIDCDYDAKDKVTGITIMLQKLIKTLRNLYIDTDDVDHWKLWFDLHGGLREMSMVVYSVLQLSTAFDLPDSRHSGADPASDKGGSYAMDVSGQNHFPVEDIFTVNGKKGNHQWEVSSSFAIFKALIDANLQQYLNNGANTKEELAPEDCEGKKFAFVSYKHNCHEDYFLNFLGTLKDIKLHYWYDDGIHKGDNWQQKLNQHIEDCQLFIALLSKEYLSSKECIKEIRQAEKLHKNKIFIYLESPEIVDKNFKNGQLVVSSDNDSGEKFILKREDFPSNEEQQIVLSKFYYNGAYQSRSLQKELLRDDKIRALISPPGNKKDDA